jgi:hypothetical protein
VYVTLRTASLVIIITIVVVNNNVSLTEVIYQGYPNLLNIRAAYDIFKKFRSRKCTCIGWNRCLGTSFLRNNFFNIQSICVSEHCNRAPYVAPNIASKSAGLRTGGNRCQSHMIDTVYAFVSSLGTKRNLQTLCVPNH